MDEREESRRVRVPVRDLPGVRWSFESRVGFAAGASALLPLVAMLALGQGAVPVGILLVATVPTALVAWWGARRIARRVRLLAAATARVGEGDLDVRVRPRGNDEVDALMRAFNAMVTDMQQSHRRIAYLQRIGAWQEFAQRLAHEIKNPLTPIQLAIQEISRKYRGDDATFSRSLETAREIIEEEVETLRRLVDAFTSFARLPDVRLERGDLAEFVRDLAESRAFLEGAIAARADGTIATVQFTAPATAMVVQVDRILLRRVVDNLVRNAVQAGAQEVRVYVDHDESEAHLVIEDDGPGVPVEQRERVFDPYFTTRAEGTGLGLAIARKIALDHRGDLRLEERAPTGARFVVTLPLIRDADDAALAFVTFDGSGRTPSVPGRT